jgi:hypothetical protein
MESKYLLNKFKIRSIAILFLALFAMLSGIDACRNIDGEHKMTETTIKEITYHFGDASVPPNYHRSYTITVTADSVKIVVDSYGNYIKTI